ncbi:MAG TPA: hypothetical protein VHB48_10050 [Chitinophagaceae bacterium]|nr:hypothetical protein [Chitinophagaceae bacterium]
MIYRPAGAVLGVYITYRWVETRPNVPVWTAIYPGGPIAMIYRPAGAVRGVYITYRWVETRTNVPVWTPIHPGGPIAVIYRSAVPYILPGTTLIVLPMNH